MYYTNSSPYIIPEISPYVTMLHVIMHKTYWTSQSTQSQSYARLFPYCINKYTNHKNTSGINIPQCTMTIFHNRSPSIIALEYWTTKFLMDHANIVAFYIFVQHLHYNIEIYCRTPPRSNHISLLVNI